MKGFRRVKALIAIMCILMIAVAGASFANTTGDETGDPSNLPPGSGPLEPTPVILNAIVTMLAAAASIVLT